MRRRRLWVTLILILLLIGGAFGGLWWKGVRIQTVTATGPDASDMQVLAEQTLQGTNHFIIPNNSIFFYPQQKIRAAILKQYPDIAAVSFSRTSFSTLLISSIPREAALTWCGPTYEGKAIVTSLAVPVKTVASSTKSSSKTSSVSASTAMASNGTTTPAAPEPVVDSAPEPTCFSADAQGIIFAAVPAQTVHDTDSIVIYGPLSGDANASTPLGATIAGANMIPNALQLVKIIKSLGVSITTLVLRGDEADLYAQSGTRITYVLGREEQTAEVAEAAFPSLNLNDGSLQYVDLRFAGKAYFKKVGSNAASSTSSQ